MLDTEMSSTITCGAMTMTAVSGVAVPPAQISAIDAPSEWPNRIGRSSPSAASSAGNT